MIDKIKSYFTELEQLSSDELHRSAEKLVRVENTSIAKLIAHLAEMSSRRTALELGYKSLYDYSVRRLNLSEGAVPARIHVANVCRRFPQLLVALAESRVSLTVAALLAPHLTEDNVDKLIADGEGKTRRETEKYLVALRPKPVFEPSIRKRPCSPAGAVAQVGAPQVEPPSPSVPSPSSPPPSAAMQTNSPPILQPARPEVFNFRFSATRDFKDKFERLAEVLGVENAQKHMADVLETAIDIALEKKDPKKKLERRNKRQSRAPAPSRSDEMVKKAEPATSRYISSEVSERVHARANYQCEFHADDGTRCTARTGLELDHALPFGIYHKTDEGILRLLCASHNLFTAERVYGADFIQRKIDERRQSRSP